MRNLSVVLLVPVVASVACVPLVGDFQVTGTGRLAVSAARACVIDDGGDVYCWGTNDKGELLASDVQGMLIEAQPIPMPAHAKAQQISMGAYGQQCVTTTDQKVICWGNTGSYDLGPTNDTGMPEEVGGVTGVIEVTAGAYCTCVVLTGGTVECWGLEETGCFGDDPSGNNISGDHATPTEIKGLSGVVQLRGGGYSYPWCARLSTGHVSCWSSSFVPTEIPTVTDATDIAIANSLVFIQSETHGVLWSMVKAGNTGWTAPLVLPGGAVSSMSAGYNFVGVGSDGGIVEASLFDGPDVDGQFPAPMPIMGEPHGTLAEIAAGYGVNKDLQCLRLSGVAFASSVYCWGDNGEGALGTNNGVTGQYPEPQKVLGL